jgi:hypothetical protein
MQCPSDTDLLKWVAGELTGQEDESLVRHLGLCTQCAQQAAELKSVWGTMGNWEVDPSGHQVVDRVLGAVRTVQVGSLSSPSWRQPWRWPVPIRAAASILLAAGIGWSAGRFLRTESRAPAPAATPKQGMVAGDLFSRTATLEGLMRGMGTGLAIPMINSDPGPLDQEDRG